MGPDTKEAQDTLKEIIQKTSTFNTYEKRDKDNDYFEVVIYTREIHEWEKVLTDILGPVAKPPRVKPTREDLRLTYDYGGIRKNQTLFKKEFADTVVMAMLWPWEGQEYITLKVVIVRR